MGVTLVFTCLKKFGPCFFHCSKRLDPKAMMRRVSILLFRRSIMRQCKLSSPPVFPFHDDRFKVFKFLANPQVHEKKGNLFKCSTENRFVLMTRGTT